MTSARRVDYQHRGIPTGRDRGKRPAPTPAHEGRVGDASKLLLSPERPPRLAPRRHYARAVELTSLVTAGGCAAKYSAARLEELLRGFVPAEAENLLVGLDPADDAAVYRLDDERAIVFTLDFFPPLVDDPRAFGRIAATNALNDVFAMGGVPLLALSVACFPEELDRAVVRAVLDGADEQVRAAGAFLAGGHTLRDEVPKYGLAVVGTVHPDAVWPKGGARPGDALFLTKPLGTGLVLHGHKRGLADEDALAAAVEWMTTLNGEAAEALRPFEPSAVTDVTGFGLLGHAHEMASRSGVRIELDAGAARPPRGAREAARASGPAATGATATSPRRTSTTTGRGAASRSRGTRRPPAGCSSSCPRRARCSRPRSPREASSSRVSDASPKGRASPLRSSTRQAVDPLAPCAYARACAARAGARRLAVPDRDLRQPRPADRSGLGCESWPGCEAGSFFPEESHHAFVEFGNRVFASSRSCSRSRLDRGLARSGLPRWVTWIAGLTFLGTIGQAPLGMITIYSDLHPLLVMSHFLLALVVLAGAIVVAVETLGHARGGRAPGCRAGRGCVGSCSPSRAASSSSPGRSRRRPARTPAERDIRRLGNLVDAVYIHVRATAVFGISSCAARLAPLQPERAGVPGVAGRVLLGAPARADGGRRDPVAQRAALGLVLVHVALAAARLGADGAARRRRLAHPAD